MREQNAFYNSVKPDYQMNSSLDIINIIQPFHFIEKNSALKLNKTSTVFIKQGILVLFNIKMNKMRRLLKEQKKRS